MNAEGLVISWRKTVGRIVHPKERKGKQERKVNGAQVSGSIRCVANLPSITSDSIRKHAGGVTDSGIFFPSLNPDKNTKVKLNWLKKKEFSSKQFSCYGSITFKPVGFVDALYMRNDSSPINFRRVCI